MKKHIKGIIIVLLVLTILGFFLPWFTVDLFFTSSSFGPFDIMTQVSQFRDLISAFAAIDVRSNLVYITFIYLLVPFGALFGLTGLFSKDIKVLRNRARISGIITMIMCFIPYVFAVVGTDGGFGTVMAILARVDKAYGFYVSGLIGILIFGLSFVKLDAFNYGSTETATESTGEVDTSATQGQAQKALGISKETLIKTVSQLKIQNMNQIGFLVIGIIFVVGLIALVAAGHGGTTVLTGLILIGLSVLAILKYPSLVEKIILKDELLTISGGLGAIFDQIKALTKLCQSAYMMSIVMLVIIAICNLANLNSMELAQGFALISTLAGYFLFLLVLILLGKKEYKDSAKIILGLSVVNLLGLFGGLFLRDYAVFNFHDGFAALLFWTVGWYVMEIAQPGLENRLSDQTNCGRVKD